MSDSLAAFHLSPEEEEEQIKQVADEEIDLLREALKQTHDDGYIVFGPARPAKRLAQFDRETLPHERDMLLDPLYLEALDAGYYPPPQEFVFFLVDERGQPLNPYPAFADEQTAIMAGLQIGLITPEMLQAHQAFNEAVMAQEDPSQQMPKEMKKQMPEHIPPPIPEQPMPLPIAPFKNFWFGLMSLPAFDNGKDGPLVWELEDYRKLTEQLERRKMGMLV
jgi:hypothetical protein